MKLICPHCGLKGTAEEALQEKKVRCPQCLKIFRLNDTVIISAESGFQQNASVEQSEDSGKEKPGQSIEGDIPASHDMEHSAEISASGVGICSVCGFSLSYTYLEEKDGKLYCRICLPA
jgi:hypothetical protein